jgi:hypothetical protein
MEPQASEAVKHNDSRDNLQQQALILFQCKDGSLVSNPRQCKQTVGALPELEITGKG